MSDLGSLREVDKEVHVARVDADRRMAVRQLALNGGEPLSHLGQVELGNHQAHRPIQERRIVQAVRLASADGRTYVVANLHCTSYPDPRLADAELLRAAWFTASLARPDDVVVLAGDFNVPAAHSQALRDLTGPEWGFSPAGPAIDHFLVRGAEAAPVHRWPDARRERSPGELLSDHAPVEVEIT